MYFLHIIFQQDNAPVHKSKIFGTFSKKTGGMYWNGQNTVQIWILLKNYGQFLKQQLQKQTVCWEYLEDKVYEFWN